MVLRRLGTASTYRNELHLEARQDEAAELVPAALLAWNGELASVVGVDERPLGRQFAVYYVIASRNSDQFLHVRVDVPADVPTFTAITPNVPAANWGEREVADLLGLRPVGHPDPRPLVLHDRWPVDFHPLRRDVQTTAYTSPRLNAADVPIGAGAAATAEAAVTSGRRASLRTPYQPNTVAGEGIVQIPVGPIHAGIIEPGHFRFSSTGERVLHLDARLFYTHRGLEKLVEGMPVQQAISTVEATCGVCSVAHAVAFSRACERLADCVVPEQAEMWRALLLELERLYNHIGDVGNICAGVGLAYGVHRGAALKERLMQLNEQLTGHRFLRHMVVPGGLRHDLTVDGIADTVTAIAHDFAHLVAQLWDEATLLDRLRTTGRLDAHTARMLGVVGPAARASGVSGDWRIYHPQPGYAGLQMSECLRESGDVEARALLRIDEVRVSTDLVQQLCARLAMTSPSGDQVWAPLGPMPVGRPVLGYCESPRGAMVHWLMADTNNSIYRLHIRSASYANWPAVPLTVPGNIVPDFPLINKSFELCYACCDR